MLSELGKLLDGPISIYGDNQGVIILVKNLINYKRIRYINVSYYFVRELISNKILTLIYLFINKMIIDDLIKTLILVKFADFVEILGLKDGEFWLAGLGVERVEMQIITS